MKIKEKKPAWILLAGDAAERCLKNEDLPQYLSRIKFGSQYLWGIYPQESRELDLTPLYRELKPPVDCVPFKLEDTPWIKFK
jgi:hypothetical protein